jgi:hypothetical protein
MNNITILEANGKVWAVSPRVSHDGKTGMGFSCMTPGPSFNHHGVVQDTDSIEEVRNFIQMDDDLEQRKANAERTGRIMAIHARRIAYQNSWLARLIRFLSNPLPNGVSHG